MLGQSVLEMLAEWKSHHKRALCLLYSYLKDLLMKESVSAKCNVRGRDKEP